MLEAPSVVGVTVPVPTGASLVPGSVTTTAGTVGAGTGVSVDVGTLAKAAVATIHFDLRIDDPLAAGIAQIAVQGTVASNELAALSTDDPDTFAAMQARLSELNLADPDPNAFDYRIATKALGGSAKLGIVRSGSGGGPPGPAVGAVTPAEGTTITKPTAISATLTPAAGTTVTGWTVSYRRADDTTLTELASGTGTAVAATVDPTVLPNGAYVLVIHATSSDGGSTESETSLIATNSRLESAS